ncbi:MAG: DNA-binding protein WhiA [Vulcanimicrobiaceae bacterium]
MSGPATLSADTKDALARELPEPAHCRAALRAGLARYGTAAGSTIFRSARLTIARLFARLHEDRKTHAVRTLVERRLRRGTLYEVAIDPTDRNAPKPTRRCDRRIELRAAFLGCGSIAAPTHGYHLEFVPPDDPSADRLAALLRADGHAVKLSRRRGRRVLYFKEIDGIARCLTAIGAFGAVLHLEDVRAFKETKNRIHRLVNTEAANVDRASAAAAAQRSAIVEIVERYGLHRLTPALRETAELRLRYPSDSLAELGRRCRPPVGKPTISGRVAALTRLAGRLRTGGPATGRSIAP